MRRILIVLACLIGSALAVACGQAQADDLATRDARTVALLAPTALPLPAIANADAAIRVARTVVSPYIATWQDVIATEENGVWRVVFRNYDPLPAGAVPNDDYWRVPLSVFIDASSGIVLRQGYV